MKREVRWEGCVEVGEMIRRRKWGRRGWIEGGKGEE